MSLHEKNMENISKKVKTATVVKGVARDSSSKSVKRKRKLSEEERDNRTFNILTNMLYFIGICLFVYGLTYLIIYLCIGNDSVKTSKSSASTFVSLSGLWEKILSGMIVGIIMCVITYFAKRFWKKLQSKNNDNIIDDMKKKITLESLDRKITLGFKRTDDQIEQINEKIEQINHCLKRNNIR